MKRHTVKTSIGVQPAGDLPTEELLALVGGTGRARTLLARHRLRDIAQLSPAELAAEGMPAAGARRLAGAFELCRRFGDRPLPRGEPFTSSRAVFDAFHS